MLGVLARHPASTRFRAGRGIAIAVVTVASLGVGGLAAAGPGVFQAAANKARSLVTPDSADTEDAGAANGGDSRSGSQRDDTNGADAATGALASAIQQAAAGDLGATPADGVTPTAPPPQCVDGNHGDTVSPVANGSVPPSAEEDHNAAVNDVAHDTCTPQGPQGNAVTAGSNPNQPEVQPAGPPISTPNGNENSNAGGDPTPVTGPPPSTPGDGNSTGNGDTPSQGGQNQGGQGGGQSTNNGQGGGQGTNTGQVGGQDANNGQGQSNTPPVSVPPGNGQNNGRGNGG